MMLNYTCHNNQLIRLLVALGLSLCFLNITLAKPRKPALGIGLETGLAHHLSEDRMRPTVGLRASFSFLETVRRELGRGLPTNWVGVYGRVQNDFDDHLRTAVGLTAGYYILSGELGWSSYGAEQSDYSGPELLVSVGLFDIVGLYTRYAWLSSDHSIFELGFRVSYPLWVGEEQRSKRRVKPSRRNRKKKTKRQMRRQTQSPKNKSYRRANKKRR